MSESSNPNLARAVARSRERLAAAREAQARGEPTPGFALLTKTAAVGGSADVIAENVPIEEAVQALSPDVMESAKISVEEAFAEPLEALENQVPESYDAAAQAVKDLSEAKSKILSTIDSLQSLATSTDIKISKMMHFDEPIEPNEVNTPRLSRGIKEGTLTAKQETMQEGTFVIRASDGEMIPEPKTPHASKYPFNKVEKSESGHIREVDDTPKAERIKESHRTGTFYEVHPDGTRVTKIVKDNFTVTIGDDYTKVSGACNVQVDGDTNLTCLKDVNVQSVGDVNVTCGGDAKVMSAKDADVVALAGDATVSSNFGDVSAVAVTGSAALFGMQKTSVVSIGQVVVTGTAGVTVESAGVIRMTDATATSASVLQTISPI